jgi:large subunit ribosomal protein L10
MNRDEKAQAIEEIAADIEAAEAIFAVDYRGISVPQAAELRGKLREADASFRVVKNRLTKIAAQKAGEDRLGELLQGPTALTFVRGDTAQAAKAISTFNKEHDVIAFKGGFMDGLSLDEEKFKSIARLPGRDALNGQLAGVVASPLTGLVRGLGSMIQGLALQLGQIAEKGLVSGEGPNAPAAGPVEDETEGDNPDASPADVPAEDADGKGASDAPAEEEEPTETPAKETANTSETASKSDSSQSSEEEPDAEQGEPDPAAADAERSTPAEADEKETSDSADDDTSKEEE